MHIDITNAGHRNHRAHTKKVCEIFIFKTMFSNPQDNAASVTVLVLLNKIKRMAEFGTKQD